MIPSPGALGGGVAYQMGPLMKVVVGLALMFAMLELIRFLVAFTGKVSTGAAAGGGAGAGPQGMGGVGSGVVHMAGARVPVESMRAGIKDAGAYVRQQQEKSKSTESPGPKTESWK